MGGRPSLLLRLLGISHRYHVIRLLAWCENQLCKLVSVPEVCSILCQAHLYQAEELEKVCLSFLKTNMTAVVATAGFTELMKSWPEVVLKVNVFLAGIIGSAAATILDEGFGRKRPTHDKETMSESKRQRTE